MSLDQIKCAYPCLPAFVMTEHWLKHQPKMLPRHIAVNVPSYEDAPTTTKLLQINLP